MQLSHPLDAIQNDSINTVSYGFFPFFLPLPLFLPLC